jgi:hypothetical protein
VALYQGDTPLCQLAQFAFTGKGSRFAACSDRSGAALSVTLSVAWSLILKMTPALSAALSLQRMAPFYLLLLSVLFSEMTPLCLPLLSISLSVTVESAAVSLLRKSGVDWSGADSWLSSRQI